MTDASSLKAILGPTNTGKTFFAIERMLAHRSGMIGLPLRLLAREVYGRVVARIGKDAVALVTGEERIVPPKARYWVCTVEAMPLDVPVECLAVDEIQVATDFDRGHVFTNRILHARGLSETLLLGAATMAPLIRTLLPNAEIIYRPRFSTLTYAGSKKISRQPPRSAIVAFSAREVYAIAELIRRERGGAAVVMGALSPRTRNAQVDMYQNGDVDFLVATDAIGMGLNLDVHHVAFADDRKFDGHQTRPLTPAEFGQIAGRAGRHMHNGTFGVTGNAGPFDEELIVALEGHDFEPVRQAQWRNADLEFGSLAALRDSLDVSPGIKALTRVPVATDQQALEFLSRNEAGDLAVGRPAVELLWQCCALPDYRDISPAQHGEIITRIYTDLRRHGAIATDWIAEQVRFCDNASGDIDTLSNRIRQIRTWTYVANRKNWLEDPAHWREKTRDIEDRLSDALHERLTQRFVDRRTSVLMRHLRDRSMANPEINDRGDISLEGHLIGSIQGFRFTLSRSDGDTDAKALASAAAQVVAPEIAKRADRLAGAPNEEFVLATDGQLRWRGEVVATIAEGDTLFTPRLIVLADEVKALDQDVRAKMRKLGIKFGAYHIYVPLALKPAPRELAIILYALKNGGIRQPGVTELPHTVLSGRTSFQIDPEISTKLYEVAGFKVAGRRAVRVDILERLADIIRPLIALDAKTHQGEVPVGAAEGNGFRVTVEMTSLLGTAGDDFASILTSLGYRVRRVPKVVAPPVVEAPAPDVSAETTAPADASVPEAETAVAPAPETVAPPEAATAEAAPVESEAAPAPAAPSDEASVPLAETAPELPPVTDVTRAEPVVAAEPEFDEIWSPGGRRPDAPRPHARRPEGDAANGEARAPRPPRRFNRDRDAAAPAPARADGAAPPAEAAAPAPPPKPRSPRFDAKRPKPFGGDDRNGRDSKPKFGGKRESSDWKEHRPREERKTTVDPDSPWAALLALRNPKSE